MEQVKKTYSLLFEYCLLTFIILWSGGSFTYGLWKDWPYYMTVIAIVLFYIRNLKLERNTIIIIGLYLIVIVLQTTKYEGQITSIFAPFFRILSIAMAATILRPNLSHVFIRIVTAFSVISVFFWCIDITPNGHQTLIEIAKQLPQFGGQKLSELEGSAWELHNSFTLYFYSVSDYNLMQESDFYLLERNSGPFFEPGRFTIVLVIAMAMILFSGQYKKYKTPFYLILAANLTTFSTTGNLTMIVLFLFYLIRYRRSVRIKRLLAIVLFVFGVYYLMQQNFMHNKIVYAMSDTEESNSRFGAMFYHWSQIVQSPLIGYGSYLGRVYKDLEFSPCGITDMMRIWGIPIFLFSVWLLYYGTKTYLNDNKVFRLAMAFILLLLAYSQTIMTAPLYYLLYFLGVKNTKNER